MRRESDPTSPDIYRELLQALGDGFCVFEVLFDSENRPYDYRFLEANAAFEMHTGLRDARGKTARELVPDLDESWFRLYGNVALTGEPARFENHEPAMGRWFEVLANRVGPPELRRVALIFKNITERKLVEARLQESESRFRNMADHAPVMLWVTDSDGMCIYLNRRWYDVTGQTEETGLGAGWLEAIHPEDAAQAAEILHESNAARQPFRLEYRLRDREGVYRHVIDAASPRFDESGTFLGYVGSVVDISELRTAQQEREALLERERAARSQAEQANHVKDEFIATVSHELRTPLSAMLGWVQLLRTGSLAPKKHERALETIERNARAQTRLIEDLLDVGRILSGKLRLDVSTVDISSVVEEALESVRPAAEAKGVRVQSALDSTSSVMGDASRLQQVVWNLLSNAVKFTPKGGRVQVFVERRDSAVEITVADTGKGIPEWVLPHVFERFRQVASGPARETPGLGLGLSIVRHLIEAHGGTVRVFSDGDGKGATFVVRLPLSVALRREVAVPPQLRQQSELANLPCPPEIAGLRFLVVDDDADIRDVMRALLEGCDAYVVTAASAAEALQALENDVPDVLISDIGMPGEDGYAFIRKVRENPTFPSSRLPAVALTAYARVEDRTRALLSGFQSHVPKPMEPIELLAVLASLAPARSRRSE